MSGYLGLVVEAATSVLSRPAPLTIGPLVLQGHEVPSRITIGGSQAVTIHKLPGGGRIIDAMGADDGTISWRGLFVGPDAARRARMLDTMRMQGTSQALSFGDYTFDVIVVHCEYDYQERGSIINYRVRTERVPDPDSLTNVSTSLDFMLKDDLDASRSLLVDAAAAALAYATLAGKADAAQITASAFDLNGIATGIASTALDAVAPILSTASGGAAVQSGLQTAGTTLQAGIRSLSRSLVPSFPTDLGIATAPVLARSAAQAAGLAGLVQAGGHVNRAWANLASANAQTLAPLVHA